MRNPLHALCPYYAMFPETFAEEHIASYTKPGDLVFDPFSGRGTTLLQALLMGRRAAAIDINPVAYCVSAAKARVPRLARLQSELERLESAFLGTDPAGLAEERRALPQFFRRAFHFATLNQLLFLRGVLDWERDDTQCFVAALVLGILHGEMGRSVRYLSNQMPRTISPKPRYALDWWRDRSLWPERRDVFSRLREEARGRLRTPPTRRGVVARSDARRACEVFPSLRGQVRAVITSPPYFNVTRFEEDQWLRLWFLGHVPRPTYREICKDDRYLGKERYWRFMTECWQGIAPLLSSPSVIVCRVGAVGMDQQAMSRQLTASIRTAFPGAQRLGKPRRTDLRKTQTRAFRPAADGCRFEVDHAYQV